MAPTYRASAPVEASDRRKPNTRQGILSGDRAPDSDVALPIPSEAVCARKAKQSRRPLNNYMNAFTLTEVAAAFDVRKNTVTDWKKDGCPALQTAPYDLDAIEGWLKENNRRAATAPVAGLMSQSDMNERKIKADIRLKQVKTRLHRYQLAVKCAR